MPSVSKFLLANAAIGIFFIFCRLQREDENGGQSTSRKPSHGNFQIFEILIHVIEEERFSEHLSTELCNPEHRSELEPRFLRQA